MPYFPFNYGMMDERTEMAPSTRRRGVRRISGEDLASAVGERVDSPSSSIGSTQNSSCDRLAPFSIHFTNIRGLKSNKPSVEHHLKSLPNILLLSETQVSDGDSSDFNISHYNLFSNFRLKGGVCAYCNTNTPVERITKQPLYTKLYDVIWLRISLRTTTIFLCFCYCSPNSTDFVSFFDYLTLCRESLLSSNPHAEVLILGDFNVHHTEWLGSNSTDVGGIEAHSFSVTNEMEQLIKHPTRVPDRHDHAANILDLFFTSNSSNYSYSVSAPLGSSDHKVISVTCSFSSPPPVPPTERQLWYFKQAQCDNIRTLIPDFPWEDYCFTTDDPSVVSSRVTEVFSSIMEAYVPSTIKSFPPAKPWFDRGSSRAVQSKELAHASYEASPTDFNLSTYKSARNRCTSQLRRRKHLFVKKKTSNSVLSLTEV